VVDSVVISGHSIVDLVDIGGGSTGSPTMVVEG